MMNTDEIKNVLPALQQADCYKLAKEEGRSRKNLCETEIRKLIEAYSQKLKSGSNNA